MWYLPVLIDLGAAGLIAQDPHTGNFSPLFLTCCRARGGQRQARPGAQDDHLFNNLAT
jgi:hypothetical protein